MLKLNMAIVGITSLCSIGGEPQKISRRMARVNIQNRHTAIAEYPENLFNDLGLGITSPTSDQVMGLYHLCWILKKEHREVVEFHYREGMSYKEIAQVIGVLPATIRTRCKKALLYMRDSSRVGWIIKGYDKYFERFDDRIKKLEEDFIREGKYKQAELLYEETYTLPGVTMIHAGYLSNAGCNNIGTLLVMMEDPHWYDKVSGIDYKISKRIIEAMCRRGFIERSS